MLKQKILTATCKSLKTKNLLNINADKVSSILCYVHVYFWLPQHLVYLTYKLNTYTSHLVEFPCGKKHKIPNVIPHHDK